MRLTLPAHPPFSFNAVVRSHGWAGLAPFKIDANAEALSYVNRLTTGRVIKLHIQESEGGVSVEVDEPASQFEREEISTDVAWMLGLDQDFSEFYALARREQKLAHVEERAQGRLLRSPTLFEDTVKTILTTNTSWSGTIRMVEALVSHFGEPIPDSPAEKAFPTPERLASTDPVELRSTARLGYRSPYVTELSQAVASGSLDLETLKQAEIPTDQLRKKLLSIKGVGAYAAANLMMILGRYDFLPVDSWALKVVSHEWHGGDSIGKKEVEAAFERWGKWKGLVFWFWDWSYLKENN